MDLRVQKTRNNIINAFIKLRTRKPIEKITVKELSELAMINKATFYLHYNDIYDLSDSLENELITNCLKTIPNPDALFSKEGCKELAQILNSQGELFRIIFSASRTDVMVEKLEAGIKQLIFQIHPEYTNDVNTNVTITALIHGCFYAYFEYEKKQDPDKVIDSLSQICASCFSSSDKNPKLSPPNTVTK